MIALLKKAGIVPLAFIVYSCGNADDMMMEESSGTAVISGYILKDTGTDGQGDTPITDANIRVSTIDGKFIDTSIPDENGYYEATNLEAGTYKLISNLSVADSTLIDIYDGDESNDGDPLDGILDADDYIEVVLSDGEVDTDNNFIKGNLPCFDIPLADVILGRWVGPSQKDVRFTLDNEVIDDESLFYVALSGTELTEKTFELERNKNFILFAKSSEPVIEITVTYQILAYECDKITFEHPTLGPFSINRK